MRAKGGRAGKRYRETLTLKKVRKIKRRTNQMRIRDSGERHISDLFRQTAMPRNGSRMDQGANWPQIWMK
jgi:hypothetical protein